MTSRQNVQYYRSVSLRLRHYRDGMLLLQTIVVDFKTADGALLLRHRPLALHQH